MRYIYLGRTGLPAWSKGLIFNIKIKKTLGWSLYLEDILWAGSFAGPAPDAFLLINNGKSLRTYLQGVKKACFHTVSMSQAANVAFPFPAI